MRVIVAGAGIGGLSTAIALRRDGQEVILLERAPRLDAVGAGITLFANAMQVLDRLGVGDAVRAAGAAARRGAILTSAGRTLTTTPADLLEGAVAVHRGDLQSELAHAAGDVRLDARVASAEQTHDQVVAQLSDGTAEHGDLLVAADGLHSVVRGSIAPSTPRYAGYTAWRGVSSARLESGRLTESWGIGERFGLVDIGTGTYWFATANAPEGEADHPDQRKARLIEHFANWHSPIPTVLAQTPNDAILRNDVYFLDPLPRWSHGRIVLLGDAAHAMTPGVGQGAAQALEDAVALAHALSEGGPPSGAAELRAALDHYESSRRPRAELALKLSRRADAAAQLANPLGCRVRNAVSRRIPESFQRRQLSPIIHTSLP